MCATDWLTVRRAFLVLIPICLLGCVQKTQPQQTTGPNPSRTAVSKELAVRLSGIYYRGPASLIETRDTREFSWGTQDFDYYKALYIDLLAATPTLGYKEQQRVVNKMMVAASGDEVELFLALTSGESAGTLLIKIPLPSLNMISLYRQDKSNLIWHEELTGSYFKLDGPGLDK
jgi:hypothetical protein